MLKRDKVLREAKARLMATFGERIKDVILFGSRAWGKPGRWSDWDFVVIVRGEHDWKLDHAIWDTMYRIDLDFEVFTQTLVVSEDELKHTTAGFEPVYVKALAEGIYA